MSNKADEQLITIGQAVEILQKEFPDVSISSLRFLEREGLLSPQRKPGGHRVFTTHDLYQARRIKQWQAERKSLKEIRDLLERAAAVSDFDAVVSEVTAHLLGGSIPDALVPLYDLVEAGIPLIDICEQVVTPILLNLGDDHGNHLIPVDMQFELDEHLVRFLAAAANPPENPAGKPVVVVCTPIWERHDMPVRMLAAFLEERGASVHFLGPMVDKGFLLDAMERLIPDYILVSMTVTPAKRVVTEWFKTVIGAMSPNQKLLAGGMGSHAAAHLQSDHLLVLGTESFSETINRIIEPEG